MCSGFVESYAGIETCVCVIVYGVYSEFGIFKLNLVFVAVDGVMLGWDEAMLGWDEVMLG